MKTIDVHISTIQPGDTVLHYGEVKTVGIKNRKRGFMGVTLFGDSYRLGTQLVKKVIL